MKTALCITNCSGESPRRLHEYWSSTEEPVRLTVVHPYDLDSDQPLTKETARTAKQQAESRLRQWTNELLNSRLGDLRTETLLADFYLALQLHLIIRKYDYLLVIDQQPVLSPALLAVVNQTQTQVRCLTTPAGTFRDSQPGCVALLPPAVFAVAC